MKFSSAEASKYLKKLQSEYESILNKEQLSCTFLASISENPDNVRPEYNYGETKDKLINLELNIRKLKHAINQFNTTTVIPQYGITIDEMLVLIPQLTAQKQKLCVMASRLPKAREEHGYGQNLGIIDYRYANYDINEINDDYIKVSDELSKAQLALDLINHSAEFEVEL